MAFAGGNARIRATGKIVPLADICGPAQSNMSQEK